MPIWQTWRTWQARRGMPGKCSRRRMHRFHILITKEMLVIRLSPNPKVSHLTSRRLMTTWVPIFLRKGSKGSVRALLRRPGNLL